MVDFTQQINNGDMVKGLNSLINRNMDLYASYDSELSTALVDETHYAVLHELRDLHEQHARLIGDTVRLLGGAPDYEQDAHRWVTKGRALLAHLGDDTEVLQVVQSEEERLQQAYLSCIEALKASPESVAVINQAREELEPIMGRLQGLVSGEQV